MHPTTISTIIFTAFTNARHLISDTNAQKANAFAPIPDHSQASLKLRYVGEQAPLNLATR